MSCKKFGFNPTLSIKPILSVILDFLIPGSCVICRNLFAGAGTLCPECIVNMPIIKTPVCSRCGYVLNVLYDSEGLHNYLCAECRLYPPYYDKAIGTFHYEGLIKKLIFSFKYKHKSYVGNDIATIMFEYSRRTLSQYSFDLVFHVPLHINKVKKRGFDQSYILAEYIGRNIGVVPVFGNIERAKQTESQTCLNRKERKKNVAEAFVLKNPDAVKGKTILLVDDVYTTGATTNECSKVIKKAGAEKIIVFTAARA